MNDTVKPLVYDILLGLLAKGITVRVNLQTGSHRAEGTLVKLVPLDELRDIRGKLGTGVRVYYDSIAEETPPPPLEFRISELENCSSLKQIDIGFLLTLNHEAST